MKQIGISDRVVVNDDGEFISLDIYTASANRRIACVSLDTSAAIAVMRYLAEAVARRFEENKGKQEP